jgi:hypothetical protein
MISLGVTFSSDENAQTAHVRGQSWHRFRFAVSAKRFATIGKHFHHFGEMIRRKRETRRLVLGVESREMTDSRHRSAHTLKNKGESRAKAEPKLGFAFRPASSVHTRASEGLPVPGSRRC